MEGKEREGAQTRWQRETSGTAATVRCPLGRVSALHHLTRSPKHRRQRLVPPHLRHHLPQVAGQWHSEQQRHRLGGQRFAVGGCGGSLGALRGQGAGV